MDEVSEERDRARQDEDRYLRARAGHKEARRAELWLGPSRPLTDSSIYQMHERRTNQAKIGHIKTHVFHHSFAHAWLASQLADLI